MLVGLFLCVKGCKESSVMFRFEQPAPPASYGGSTIASQFLIEISFKNIDYYLAACMTGQVCLEKTQSAE